MGFKMGAIAGFAAGYYLGAKAGRERYEQINRFERILSDVQQKTGMRMLAWCLMPNHWHLVLWPREDGELSQFVRLVTLTHAQRWHAHRGTAGMGHLYQGRFKSFVVRADDHLLTVCRYVEANALRGGLVARAEDWRWSSLGRSAGGGPTIEPWPVPKPPQWAAYVNEQCSREELDRLRSSTLRPRGRPRKKVPDTFFR